MAAGGADEGWAAVLKACANNYLASVAEPGPETQTVAEWQKEFMGGEANG